MFIQQLPIAVQVYCENEAGEVCYMHMGVGTVEPKHHPCRQVQDRNAERLGFAVMMNPSLSQRFSSVNIIFRIFPKAPHLDLKS